jgi:hypothetical protein
MLCIVTQVKCGYLGDFLNIPKKPDVRFLRGTGVTCESESDSMDWAVDGAGLVNLGSSLVGETSIAGI